jgi:hypothetical protein
MDPMVELIHRWNVNHPEDHSLDGLPLTPGVVTLLSIFAVSLALGLTGRSWKLWHFPAMCVWFTWWARVHVGRYGPGSILSLLMMAVAVSLLFEPAKQTFTAALSPSKRG